MYQAVNDYIIIEKETERKTDFGIIVAEQDTGSVFEFIVVATNEKTAALQGKTIYAERRYCQELPSLEDRRLAALNYNNVLAIK
jgi:co-chaperonin GroES (HSP10)